MSSLDGMLAEEVVLSRACVGQDSSRYSFEQASTLPCAGVTAWHALFAAFKVGPGATVLVQGGGGVSTIALQLALRAGARVIATSSSAGKRARLAQMGAASTIDYTTDAKWGDTARSAAGNGGVDLVVEVGGAGTFDQSIAGCASWRDSLPRHLAARMCPSILTRFFTRTSASRCVVGSSRFFELSSAC